MPIKTVFAVFLVLAGFASMSFAGTIQLSNSKITLTGSGTIKVDPVEKFWAGISRRYPTILSGDLIALKLARSSGTPKWIQCSKTKPYHCTTSTCPGGQVIPSSKFASCPTVVFRIRTLGKQDGQAVEAGDYVVMTFPTYGETRYLRCNVAPSPKAPCDASSNLGAIHLPRKHWLYWNSAKFQIFAKNADEGTPIQYGDIAGFKFGYQSGTAFLYSDGSKTYARACPNGDYRKVACTKTNSGFAFQIYKKM